MSQTDIQKLVQSHCMFWLSFKMDHHWKLINGRLNYFVKTPRSKLFQVRIYYPYHAYDTSRKFVAKFMYTTVWLSERTNLVSSYSSNIPQNRWQFIFLIVSTFFLGLAYLLYFLVLTYLYLYQENHDIDVVMTNDDALGDEIPRDQQDALRHFCYQTLKLGFGVGSSNTSYLFGFTFFRV